MYQKEDHRPQCMCKSYICIYFIIKRLYVFRLWLNSSKIWAVIAMYTNDTEKPILTLISHYTLFPGIPIQCAENAIPISVDINAPTEAKMCIMWTPVGYNARASRYKCHYHGFIQLESPRQKTSSVKYKVFNKHHMTDNWIQKNGCMRTNHGCNVPISNSLKPERSTLCRRHIQLYFREWRYLICHYNSILVSPIDNIPSLNCMMALSPNRLQTITWSKGGPYNCRILATLCLRRPLSKSFVTTADLSTITYEDQVTFK